MRIAVTGGLGVVGTPLVAELRRRSHEVSIIDLPQHHDSNYFRADVSEYRQIARLFEERPIDVVFHLAAEFGRWNGEDHYETMWRTNAVGTKNIIRLQEKHGFRLVFSSSSEVYGDYGSAMAETVMDQVPIRQMNDYAISKWVNEQQIMNSAQMHGTETVRVRLFNTYGPGEPYSPYRSANCIFVYRALHDLPYTVYRGHQRTSTYILDCARTLANVTENFKPGEVYNIAGGTLHDMETVSNMILANLGKDDGMVAYLESEPHTTRKKIVDAEKARNDLGHVETVDLQEGLGLTIAWQKEYYNV